MSLVFPPLPNTRRVHDGTTRATLLYLCQQQLTELDIMSMQFIQQCTYLPTQTKQVSFKLLDLPTRSISRQTLTKVSLTETSVLVPGVLLIPSKSLETVSSSLMFAF